MIFGIEVEIYEESNTWAKARYLVKGYNDVLWTDSIDVAAGYVRENLIIIESKLEEAKKWQRSEPIKEE